MGEGTPRYFLPVGAVVLAVALSFGIFQNCSQVQFGEIPQARGLAPAEVPVLAQEAVFDAGAREVPGLKLFFIVDNSFTMKANQLKLAEGFQNMFSASTSSSLNSFATTAFLFNTAQRTPTFGDARIGEIAMRQLSVAELEAKPASEVLGYRQGESNLGQIVGDNFGYEVVSQAAGSRTLFLPAPTLGLALDPASGKLRVRASMSKAKDESAAALAQDFQERLAVFDGNKISVGDAGRFSDIWSSESGLCAMSRVLSQSDRFLGPGEVAAFILVSDEDDSDPSGSNCVHSYASYTSEPLIDVRCESPPTTEVRYHPDACRISFHDRYLVSYSYPARRFRVPRTAITYQRSHLIRTRINYLVRLPVIQDGVVRPGVYDYRTESQTVPGDFATSSSVCQERARALGAAEERLVNSSCTRSDVAGRCDPSSASVPCLVKPQTSTVDGDYFSLANVCLTRAQALPEWSSGGTCIQNGFTGFKDGNCPSNALPGCMSEDYMKSFVDRELLINASGDGGTLLGSGDCGVARNAVVDLVRRTLDAAAPSDGTCSLRVPTNRRSVFEVKSRTASCAQQAQSYCAASAAGRRACEGFDSPGTDKGLSSSLALISSGEVACSDKCSKSGLGACPANVDGRSLEVNPAMSVRDYLRMAMNSPTIECAVTVKRDPAPQSLKRQPAAQTGNICPGSKPIEIVTKPAYIEPGQVTEKIGATSGGSLTTYIQKSLQDLFGEQRPLLSSFIRRPSDPLGSGGSVGVHYDILMTLLGGQSEGVITDTYAPALTRLSTLIKERLDRSFVLQLLQPHQQVRKVQRWSAATGSWAELAPGQWTATGKTVIISSTLIFAVEDKFKFIYW